jgi:hypothetical protein
VVTGKSDMLVSKSSDLEVLSIKGVRIREGKAVVQELSRATERDEKMYIPQLN